MNVDRLDELHPIGVSEVTIRLLVFVNVGAVTFQYGSGDSFLGWRGCVEP